jgi:HK97 family phage prohead protease
VGENGILHIKAYACAFGNVDSWDDIIEPTACDAFLAGPNAKRMAFCWQHDITTVIGKITDKGVDEYGMWFEADVLPTTVGKDAAILLKEGAITEFSIGYRADQWEWKKTDDEKTIRILKAITIYEVSPVTIAANPNARIISAKGDQNNNAPTADPAAAKSSQTNTNSIMTPEEIKALNDTLAAHKAAADKAAAELKAAQDQLKASQETIDAQAKSIDNLDKSMKALQAKCDDLAAKAETKEKATFFTALKGALEAKRDEVKAMLAQNHGSMKIEFEVKDDPVQLTTGDISNIAYGVALESGIHDARQGANVFYDAFPKDTVRATQFDWLEGTFTDNADYVDELEAPKDSDAAVVEKSRKFGKIAAHLRVSSEVADFFQEVYNWARTTAQKKIIQKIDTEILTGLGADSGAGTSTKKIYGLKSNSANHTAWSATGAKYKDATIADVILDGIAQAEANGYNIDRVYVTWAEKAQLDGLKNNNGDYIGRAVPLNGITIVPTSKLSAGELLLVETGVVRIKERPTWELEIVRNAQLDGWDVYVRKAVQTLVKSNDKYGVIYVEDFEDAIEDIDEPGGITKLAGAVNEDGQIETHPNTD